MKSKNFLGFTRKEQKRFNKSLLIGYLLIAILGFIINKSIDPFIWNHSLAGSSIWGGIVIFLFSGALVGGFIDLIRREK